MMAKDEFTGDLFSAIAPAPAKPLPGSATSAATPGGAGAAAPATQAAARSSAGQVPDTPTSDAAEFASLAARLDASPDYRVLRRFVPRDVYSRSVRTPGRALFVDLETTGLDAAADRIIEVSVVPFTYGKTSGEVGEVGAAYSSFEDPGRAIPDVVVALTGISDEMVRGTRIDDASVLTLLTNADLVLAHNAAFDRPFLERRIPAFAKVRWACSMADVNWRGAGYGGRGVGVLLYEHCREFFDAHRAEVDCRAAIQLLATPFADGTQPMQQLLQAASASRIKVSALDAPIEVKDLLKARGYRWFAGGAGRPKAWWRLVDTDALDAEREWLTREIYAGRYRASEEAEDPLRRFV